MTYSRPRRAGAAFKAVAAAARGIRATEKATSIDAGDRPETARARELAAARAARIRSSLIAPTKART